MDYLSAQGIYSYGTATSTAYQSRGHIVMSLSKNVRCDISNHVNKEIMDYFDLSFIDKCELKANQFNDLPKDEKEGLLLEADSDYVLPQLLINMIKECFSQDAIMKFANAAMDIFVSGTGKKKPYLHDEINDCFEDECRAQWGVPDEHFIDDVRRRSEDANWLTGRKIY
jgi:hypothetical protein